MSRFLEVASEAEAIDLFFEKGWTDGLPSVPPTEARVAAMLRHTRRLPQEVVGNVAPAGRKATVELVAVNAVMAGCRPEYLPVVLAAVEAVCDPRFNLDGVQATTHVCAPLLIVNGPIREALRINSGYNVFGQGWRANATIGRALRLVLMNIGGGIPGLTDQSTFGHPGKYTYCIAENEEENPWEPFHVERGFPRETSTLTVLAAEAPHSVTNHVSDDPQGILTSCADALATMGSNSMVMTNYVLVALGPEHTRTLAAHGWTKQDVKAYLFEKARKPLQQMTFAGRYGKIWNRNWPMWLDRDNPDTRVPVAASSDDVHVIVAGGPVGRFSVVIPGWTQFSHPVTKPIGTTPFPLPLATEM